MHGLGRKPSPPDSRDYRLSAYLPETWPDFASDFAIWGTGPALDQGSTPHCVGFGAAHWVNAEPVPNTYQDKDGHALYYECKVLEGEPGEEDGSYVRTAAKVLQRRGRIDKYAFGSLLDARRFLLTSGPVIFGIDWLEGFFYPDAEGIIEPRGEVCGGHAILAYAADPDYCHLVNSWGRDWGIGGTCKITWIDLATIFDEYAEAMAAVETPLDYVPPEPTLPWWKRLLDWLLRMLRS